MDHLISVVGRAVYRQRKNDTFSQNKTQWEFWDYYCRLKSLWTGETWGLVFSVILRTNQEPS